MPARSSEIRRERSTAKHCSVHSKGELKMSLSRDWSRVALAGLATFICLGTPFLWAQTLGTAPVFNTAVPGQTGAQPEGAWRNFVDWICNVIAPIGAGGAVFGAVVAFMSGRTFGRWLLSAAMLLAISGVVRLIEFWIMQGVGGVS